MLGDVVYLWDVLQLLMLVDKEFGFVEGEDYKYFEVLVEIYKNVFFWDIRR